MEAHTHVWIFKYVNQARKSLNKIYSILLPWQVDFIALWKARFQWRGFLDTSEFPHRTWQSKRSLTCVPLFLLHSHFHPIPQGTLSAGEGTPSPTPKLHSHSFKRVDPGEDVCILPEVKLGPFKQEILGCVALSSVKDVGHRLSVDMFLGLLGVSMGKGGVRGLREQTCLC